MILRRQSIIGFLSIEKCPNKMLLVKKRFTNFNFQSEKGVQLSDLINLLIRGKRTAANIKVLDAERRIKELE